MAGDKRIEQLLSKPIIPVISDQTEELHVVGSASCAIVQGIKLTKLPDFLRKFEAPELSHVQLLVHLDLIAGLENNEAGLAFIAQLQRIAGLVTVHQQLIPAARKLKLLSVLRVFLSDSRALERGLHIIGKSRPDVVDLLPLAAASKVAELFRDKKAPFITGGLCRNRDDVREAIAAGARAVTCSNPSLWKLNASGI